MTQEVGAELGMRRQTCTSSASASGLSAATFEPTLNDVAHAEVRHLCDCFFTGLSALSESKKEMAGSGGAKKRVLGYAPSVPQGVLGRSCQFGWCSLGVTILVTLCNDILIKLIR